MTKMTATVPAVRPGEFEAMLNETWKVPGNKKLTDALHGRNVTGKVVAQEADGFRVDCGLKSDCFCPNDEAGDVKLVDEAVFEVIDRYMPTAFLPGDFWDETSLKLSHIRTKAGALLATMKQTREIRDAYVLNVNKNGFKEDKGLNVKIDGLFGFIPRTEVRLTDIWQRRGDRKFPSLRPLEGKTIPVMAIPSKEGSESSAVFSHKAALDELARRFLRDLKPGQKITGTVCEYSEAENGFKNGARIRINEYITAFVPRSIASYENKTGLEELLPMNGQVEGIVEEIIVDGARRALHPDKRRKGAKVGDAPAVEPKIPADKISLVIDTKNFTKAKEATSKYNVGDIVKGKVFKVKTRINNETGLEYQSAVLVRVDDSSLGEVWCGDIGQRRVNDLTLRLAMRSEVTGKVTKVNPNSGRLSLDLSPMREDLMPKLIAAKQAGEVLEATVIALERYGVFVTFDGVIDALCHERNLKQASGGFEVLEIGQKVKVKVINAVAGDYKSVSVARKNVAD